MAAWLVPALKAVLPHVATIISAAAPVFTNRKAEAVANQAQLLQEQIAELQAAASQNSAYIKELAAQLESTVTALEEAASLAEARLRRVQLACLAAFAFSTLSLLVALFFAFR
jgi:uncharacterized protein YlxW (UPF0749 family)